MNEYRDLVRLAESAARRAAAYIRTAARPADPGAWGAKGPPGDFVTAVDREAERLIAETLTAGVPGARILGEELTPNVGGGRGRAQSGEGGRGITWVVDPLDGTANYLHGYPAYAVSIAAQVERRVVAGVVLDVPRDLLYHATQGGGAWCGERRLHVSPLITPAHALLGTGFPFKVPALLPRYLRQFATLLHAVGGIRRAGSAALDLADVAQGRFDGFWELQLAPWDIAAGALLVREAGGRITDLDGHDDIVRHGPIVAGNPAIHGWLLAVLADPSAAGPRAADGHAAP